MLVTHLYWDNSLFWRFHWKFRHLFWLLKSRVVSHSHSWTSSCCSCAKLPVKFCCWSSKYSALPRHGMGGKRLWESVDLCRWLFKTLLFHSLIFVHSVRSIYVPVTFCNYRKKKSNLFSYQTISYSYNQQRKGSGKYCYKMQVTSISYSPFSIIISSF